MPRLINRGFLFVKCILYRFFWRYYFMLSPVIHRYIFLFGIIGLAVGMMFGTAPTSIPQIILASNWVLEGKFLSKWNKIKSDKIFWILISVYLMHVLGMIHTSDLSRGYDELRIKIPLLILPLLFFTTESLSKKEMRMLLQFFSAALVMSTAWCLLYYFTHELEDIRKASRYMSHIRLGLFINLGIGVLYYLFISSQNIKEKIIAIGSIAYLIITMFVLSMITGLVMFSILSFLVLIYYFFKGKQTAKIIGSLLILSVLSCIFYLVRAEWNASNFIDESTANQAKQKSISGRPYFPVDSGNYHTENGFYITNNIQYEELGFMWKSRSQVDLYSYDKKGILVAWNLVRYLSSKGLTKDSVGVANLNDADIKNIESGITNYKYAGASPLRIRLKEFFWEYKDFKQGFNPSGNTILMRFEFWKAARYIIVRNWIFGVGTGDAQKAFNKAYLRTKTKLNPEWRLRSHNQFLAIVVSFGVIGLIVFVIFLIYPVIVLRKNLMKLFWIFYFIALLSFVTEDTLESQTGVTFFAYFNTLFLWHAVANNKPENQNL